jgi:MFS transporter, PPP family, 3-phenylpropionic acid transporter
MKKIWPFAYYFLYYAAFASLLPFFVLFYQGLGFSGTQIGLLTGLPPLITLAGAPFLTRLADASQSHKLIMSAGITGAIIVVLVLPVLQSFIVVFLLVIVFNIFMSPLSPLADSAIMSMLGEERSMYGRIRLGGTIGWGLFAPIAGSMIDTYGLRIGFWAFAAIMLINLFVSQKFTFGKPDGDGSDNGGIRVLLTNRHWIFFLLTAFLGGLGSMSAAAYLFPYMAELGASETMMGIAITISTLTELPVFFFGHHLVKRFTPRGLLLLALLMLGVRSLIYSSVTTPSLVFLVQAFGGTLFPAMWLAGVSYADQNAPPGLKSTAQGLFGAMTFGFGSAIGGLLGGPMLEKLGGRGMFFVFGIIILAGLALIEGTKKLINGIQRV